MKAKSLFFFIIFLILKNQVLAADFSSISSSGHTLYYNIIDAVNHKVEVTYPGNYWSGYTKPAGSVTIPSVVSYSGISYTVVRVSDYAFYFCNEITDVLIPNTIEKIEVHAFASCSLTHVTIPNSIKVIGESAFAGNNFVSIDVSNSVERIGENAFDCNNGSPWYSNQPEGIIYLGKVAYYYKGTAPMNTTIVLPSDTKGIAGGCFADQSNIVSITFPEGLLAIESNAFQRCGGISTITIPSSLKYIGYYAFSQCGSLTTVNYNATNAVTGENTNFYPIFSGCDNLTSLRIGNSVRIIPEYLFAVCEHISGELVLPSSLISIGRQAFFHCSNITSVTLPESLDTIQSFAFQHCTSLQSIIYNATDCHYASYPFHENTSITTIYFGNNVISIPDHLFYSLASLNGTLNLPPNLEIIGKDAFYGCSGLTGNLVIPNAVHFVGKSAFYGCSGITCVTIGTSANMIETGAFYMSSVTTINYNAINCTTESDMMTFAGDAVTSFNIGSNVKSIPNGLIYNCPNLTSITFPEGLTSIGSNNFYSCGFTGTLVLPSSLTQLGFGAFGQCTSLNSIQCNAIVPPDASAVFYGCFDIPLQVPCGSIDAYKNAQGWNSFNNISGIGTCTYSVNLSVNNPAMGSVSGSGEYLQGSIATIIASAYQGNHFNQWSDGNRENPRTILVNNNITLTAFFESNNGIDDSENLNIEMYGADGYIIIKGADGMNVKVYDLLGRLLTDIKRYEKPIHIASQGVFIVRIGNRQTRKIVVIH